MVKSNVKKNKPKALKKCTISPEGYIYKNLHISLYGLVNGALPSLSKKNKIKIIWKHYYKNKFKKIIKLSFLKNSFFLKKDLMHKEYIWITDDWSQAYYHWFTEALPRLIFMNNYLETKTLLLPNNYKNEEFIVKSLYHLKIKKIKYIDKRKKVIKNLIIAPHLAPSGDNNKYYLQELRNLFLKSFNKYINCSSNDRIYISRSKAEKRKVSNEKEIQPILKKYGFKIINFEDYSWEKQIRICLNAKYMIGIHGAGLTNSIFMKKNSSILELRDEIKQPKCYMKMADSLNFKYKNQICHLSSSNQKSPNGNYIVNKKNLEKNIKVILENEL